MKKNHRGEKFGHVESIRRLLEASGSVWETSGGHWGNHLEASGYILKHLESISEASRRQEAVQRHLGAQGV